MDVTDPLRTLEIEDSEDLFKSAFNGSAGRIKITAKPDIDTQQEKFDPPKPVTDASPDDDDLFSDCRSEIGSEAEKPSVHKVSFRSNELPGQEAGMRGSPGNPSEQSIRERLNLGKPNLEEHGEEHLLVTVSDPHKVGDGISSYMVYRVFTRTNLHCFRRTSFTVMRRYSDFLGLHEKLVARYQNKGRIIPPAPEKSIVGTTRIKMGGAEPSTPGAESQVCKANFISLRRAALERFINRVALHPVLRLDSDFVDFLECSGDLPRATSTSAISSASVFKMITRVGETVNKMAYKMEEGDAWFEEKTTHVEQMESQLKKLSSIVEAVVGCRRELAVATGQFSQSTAILATTEEAFHLSRSLEGLSRVEEKVETTLQEQADADYAHILELVRDYLSLVAAVKEVLGERVKAFLTWQNAVNTLHRKREQRSRMELGGRLDKMGTAIEDVTEWEQKVEDSQDAFQKISEVIKVEMELFQHYRVADFKKIIVVYLEDLTQTQQDMVNHWESFLPDVKRVM